VGYESRDRGAAKKAYARGEETEDSDLDILVIAPSHERLFERMATK